MIRNHGLAFKLIFFILTSTTMIFVVAFTYNYEISKREVLKKIERNAQYLTHATVNRIETVLRAVEKVPASLAITVESSPYTREELSEVISRAVSANPEIFGIGFAFEPYAFMKNDYFFAPYCYKDKDRTVACYLGSDTYRYFYLDWYQIPKELNRPIWSEPFYAEGAGNIMMATFSTPFYYPGKDGAGMLRGIATADVSLMWLKDIIAAVKIYESGYAFLISQNGVFISHPDTRLIMRESLFSVAEAIAYPELRRIGREMIRGAEGFVSLKDLRDGRKAWMYYAPLPACGWSVGIVVPEEELFADIRHLSQQIMLIGVAGFVLLCLVVAFFSGTITRPLRFLARSTSEIARGNLDIELPEVTEKDEIGTLTRSFREMKTALKEYIANLAETTAAKERIESELKIARSIQMSFLPKHFPSFADQSAFEIYAALEPAKQIGGDLYDFFLLDEEHLFFSVGDVSDKGIPAALFMAVTKTLMKGVAEPEASPSDILAKVNAELCQDNDSAMFVTVFCGILNLRTGELWYSNAGHNPPLIVRSDSEPEWLKLPEGFLLGVVEESQYHSDMVVLRPGDLLVAYTDGVTEARNRDDTLYGEQRLREMVLTCFSKPAEHIVREIMESVKQFAVGVPQADDITLLTVRFKGMQSYRRDV